MFRSAYQQKQPSQPETPVDGSTKEDPNCRTCNDFKSWSKQQQKHMFNEKLVNVAGGTTAAAAAATGVTYGAPRNDCPLDKARLGLYTWSVLHTMAAFYSINPTDNEKRDMRTFFEVLSRLYPCEYCAREFRQDMINCPINVNSQKELSLWLCTIHNRVNAKLGKPIFDCSRVNERWRDGWLDGSCN